MSARTEGLDKLRRKLVSQLPEGMRKNIRDANLKNAQEFKAKVLAIIPEDHGDLAASLTSEDVGDIGVKVSIGGPTAPYPLHLEAGHIDARTGEHVPAKPYWFPAKRVLRRRFTNRISRGVTKAIKDLAKDPAP
jgi:hypothetical protein